MGAGGRLLRDALPPKRAAVAQARRRTRHHSSADGKMAGSPLSAHAWQGRTRFSRLSSRGVFNHACHGVDRHIASSHAAQHLLIRSGDDLSAIALRWHVPWGQRDMTHPPTLRVPYGVKRGACGGRPPARPGTRLVEFFRPFKAGAGREIAFRKGGNPPSITPRFEGVDGGQGLTDQLLPKGPGLLVPALMHGFRRHGYRLAYVGARRRPWCPRRLGLTPGPNGDQRQPAWARQRRGAGDKARATGARCEVVGRKKVCSPGDRLTCASRHRSLRRMVWGRVRPPL